MQRTLHQVQTGLVLDPNAMQVRTPLAPLHVLPQLCLDWMHSGNRFAWLQCVRMLLNSVLWVWLLEISLLRVVVVVVVVGSLDRSGVCFQTLPPFHAHELQAMISIFKRAHICTGKECT